MTFGKNSKWPGEKKAGIFILLREFNTTNYDKLRY